MGSWYRSAWERTWNAATDDEASAIEAAAVRGGALVKCQRCGWCMPDDEAGERCENCSAPR